MFNSNIHKIIYVASLSLLAIALPVSYFGISVAQILLSLNFIVEGDYTKKWQRLKSNRPLLFLLSVYIVHVLWLINTSDYNFAFRDLRLKSPFFITFLIIGASVPLTLKEVKAVLGFFLATVFVSSVLCTLGYYGIFFEKATGARYISRFIYHIPYSLMVASSTLLSLWFSFQCKHPKSQFLLTALALWLFYFLFLLSTVTGIIAFFVTSAILLGKVSASSENKAVKSFFMFGSVLFMACIIVYPLVTIKSFYHIQALSKPPYKTHTLNGNKYVHYTHKKDIENNNYTFLYICDKELEKEWDKRSDIPYRGSDANQQNIRHTLYRYLTSKGLTKDSAGIWQLSKDDIRNIENGIANHALIPPLNIRERTYQLIWEVDQYHKNGLPSGHSLTQRIEFLKVAGIIIGENFLFGTGTGDVMKEFQKVHEQRNKLDSRYRYRTHNQYVTFFVSFGVFGFLWVIFALFYPFVYFQFIKNKQLITLFMVPLFMALLNEDLLEIHVGVSYFSFAYALLVFGLQHKPRF